MSDIIRELRRREWIPRALRQPLGTLAGPPPDRVAQTVRRFRAAESPPDATRRWSEREPGLAQIRASLQESESCLQQVLETALEGIWIVDAEHHTKYVNARLARMLGYAAAEMLGRPAADFVDPAALADAWAHQELVRQGQTQEWDLELVRRDGGPVWVSLRANALFDQEHRYVGSLAMMTDISARKRAEEELNQFFSLTLEMLCIASVDGRFLRVNPAFQQTLGYPSEELLRRPFLDFIHPDDRAATLAEMEKLRQGRQTLHFENRYRHQDGSYRWLAWNTSPLPKRGLLYAACRDITPFKRAEQNLLLAQQRLSHIIEFLPDATFVINRHGCVIAWNRALEEMTGVRKAEILGQGGHAYATAFYGTRRPILIDLAGDREVSVDERVYQHLERRGDTLCAECFVPRLHGGRGAHVWVTASPLRDGQGRVVGAIESVRDITERKQAEQELLASELRYHELFNSMSSGVGVYEAIEDGGEFIIKDFNRAAEGITRLRREDVIGRRLTDAFPAMRTTGPFEGFQRAWRTGQPEFHEALHYHDERLAVWVNNYIYRLPSGEVVSVFDDVTKQKQAETALRRERDFSQTVIQASSAFIVALGEDDCVLLANAAVREGLGYELEEVVGKPFVSTFFPPGEHRKIRDLLRELHNSREVMSCEAPVLTSGGATRLVEWSFRAAGGDEHPGCVIGLGTDITERRETEKERADLQEQLHQAQKMEAIGQLAGGVAHDFNNLISVILGATEQMRDLLPADHPALVAGEIIEQASQQANAVARSLLTFSRRIPAEKRTIDLHTTIEEAARLLHRVLPASIHLSVTSADEPLWVLADPTQLQQVLLNLAINARDAMPEGGDLRVRLSRTTACRRPSEPGRTTPTSRWACLEVADTGCGMSAEVVARIFEPFFTTKPRGQGTGLGLPAVHGIIKSHGGHLWVNSRVGQGSTFKIHVPLTEEANEPEAVDQPPLTHAQQGETILLVEDHQQVREIIAMMLQSLGYQVLQASDGPAALSCHEHHRGDIHLLLLDADLPRLSGPEVLRRVRELNPAMPAILLTAAADHAWNDHLDERTLLLRKPFQKSHLARELARLLQPAAVAGGSP